MDAGPRASRCHPPPTPRALYRRLGVRHVDKLPFSTNTFSTVTKTSHTPRINTHFPLPSRPLVSPRRIHTASPPERNTPRPNSTTVPPLLGRKEGTSRILPKTFSFPAFDDHRETSSRTRHVRTHPTRPLEGLMSRIVRTRTSKVLTPSS